MVVAGAPLGAALVEATVATEPASASTTFTVTTLAPTGSGSLDDAVTQSEGNPGADVIVFDPTLVGTITLSSTLQISQDLVIDGDGRITLDGSGQRRHFLLGTANQAVTLRGLTLTNGSATGNGGSLYAPSDASLTLEHMTFTDNRALGSGAEGGAIHLGARIDLTVLDSTFSGNNADTAGGAISVRSYGTVTMARTTVTGNSAANVGGVYVSTETIAITDSVISNNTTTYTGPQSDQRIAGADLGARVTQIDGLVMEDNAQSALFLERGANEDLVIDGLAIDGATYGLRIDTRTTSNVTLRNSSITGTSAASLVAETCDGDIAVESTTIVGNRGTGVRADTGGLYCSTNQLSIRHSTITDNGAGIALYGGGGVDVQLDHTIVADNVVDLAMDVDASWSLVEDPGSHLRTSTDTITGIDPALAPATRTGALVVQTFDEDSPAFNAGDPGFTPPPSTDQIAQPRVALGRIDIGAWELQPAPPAPPAPPDPRDEPVTPEFTG